MSRSPVSIRAARWSLRKTPIKTFAAIAIGLLCLGIFTGLQMQEFNDQEATLRRALLLCDQFISAETALRQNVVSARIGVVQDYDRTVRLTNETERALARLQEVLKPLPGQADRLGRIVSGVTEQLGIVEHFKSRNAVLRNALAAFGLLDARLQMASMPAPQASIVVKLGMAILELTLNTARDVVGRVDQQIEALSPTLSGDQSELRSLLRQAVMIRDGLPAMDAALHSLMSLPDETEVRELRDAVLSRQAAIQAIAQRSRYVLSGISGVLIILLIRLAFMLRARAQALSRRASFERSIAEMSARLSDPSGASGERQISEALATLGDATGADRVCAVLGPDPAARYHWSRHSYADDPGWMRDVEAFMLRRSELAADLFYAGEKQNGWFMPSRSILEIVGLRGWAAARRGDSGFLAVGWSRGPVSLVKSETAGLTVALELLIQVHAQIRLAQDHARLEASLRKARRMETLGAFSSGIAHNFNNILAAMLGHAEIDELVRRERGEAAPNLEALRAAGQRGQDLVASILAYGRPERARPQLLDARAIFGETVMQLKATWPRDVVLHVQNDGTDAPVAGDGTQLQQVMLNVCRNAAQAVAGAGDVWTSLDTIDLRGQTVLSHGTLPPGRYVRFRVRDKGCGMDRETLDQVFEPFFSNSVGGNGLGLATAWEIIGEHNGCWNVSSTPGVGSSFEVWLPLEQSHAGFGSGSRSSAPPGQGEAVMLVNPSRLALLRDEEVIAALGFEPIGFDDAAAAIAACRSGSDRFSAVVITGRRDLPDLTHLVGALHAAAPAVPILLAVGASAKIEVEALGKAGLSDIVAYGASASDLRQALVNWVSGRKDASPHALVNVGRTIVKDRSG